MTALRSDLVERGVDPDEKSDPARQLKGACARRCARCPARCRCSGTSRHLPRARPGCPSVRTPRPARFTWKSRPAASVPTLGLAAEDAEMFQAERALCRASCLKSRLLIGVGLIGGVMAYQPGGVERVVATKEFAGRTCPYCRFPLKQDGEIALCGHCRAAHHADCWVDNGGCAVVACAGGPGKEAATGQATVAMPVAPAAAGALNATAVQPTQPAYSQWSSAGTPGAPPPPPVPPRDSGGSGNTGLIAALVVLALAIGGVAAAVLVMKGKGGASTVAQNSNATTNTPAVQTTTVVTVLQTQTATTPTTGNEGQTTSTPAAPGGGPSKTGGGSGSTSAASGAKGAIDSYCTDVNSGEYADAVNLSTSSESDESSVGTFQSEKPNINIIWTANPVSDGSGNQIVRISFYAQNTVGSDQTCRHFVISSLMEPDGSGGWLYDGHEPGTTTIDQDTPGNPNCPA